jgi:transcriptional regulator with XRE-family HTH domain
MQSGDRLREIRSRLGLTTRAVAQLSERIAEGERNPEFLISSPWLTQLENKTAFPSIYKLFTLAAIYGLSYPNILNLYGIDLGRSIPCHTQIPVRKTHLIDVASDDMLTEIELPIRFDAAFNPNKTNLLSRMTDTCGTVPLEALQPTDTPPRLYGFVGIEDLTLYPLIKPGSFVEIDPESRQPRHSLVRSEFDRSIFFVDLRSECVCAWCELVDESLFLLAHPLSPCQTRIVRTPEQGEIVGEVTGIAMRIGKSSE